MNKTQEETNISIKQIPFNEDIWENYTIRWDGENKLWEINYSNYYVHMVGETLTVELLEEAVNGIIEREKQK